MKKSASPIGYQMLAFMLETLSWGDVGLYLVTPEADWALVAVEATGTPSKSRSF